MNLELGSLTKLKDKIAPQLEVMRRNLRFMYFIFFAVLCGFLVFRIDSFSQAEPPDEAVIEKVQALQRPKIDEAALQKIQQLQNQNVEVKSLFQQARDNPFSE